MELVHPCQKHAPGNERADVLGTSSGCPSAAETGNSPFRHQRLLCIHINAAGKVRRVRPGFPGKHTVPLARTSGASQTTRRQQDYQCRTDQRRCCLVQTDHPITTRVCHDDRIRRAEVRGSSRRHQHAGPTRHTPHVSSVGEPMVPPQAPCAELPSRRGPRAGRSRPRPGSRRAQAVALDMRTATWYLPTEPRLPGVSSGDIAFSVASAVR